MADVGYQLLKQLVALSSGRLRVPRFQSLTFRPTAEPTTAADGVDVAEATAASIAVLQEWSPDRFTLWVRFDVVPAGCPFDVRIITWLFGGSKVYTVSSAGGDATEAASALVDAMLADPEVDSDGVNILSAAVDPTDPTVVKVELDADVSFATTFDEDLYPTAKIRAWADSRHAAWELWGRDKALGRWQRVPTCFISSTRTQSVRVDVSGFERVYIRVTATDGVCLPAVFVSELETRGFTVDAAVEAFLAERAKLISLAPDDLPTTNGTFGFAQPPDDAGQVSRLPSCGQAMRVDVASAVRGLISAFLLGFAKTPLTERRIEELLHQLDPAAPLLSGTLGTLGSIGAAAFVGAYEGRPDLVADTEASIAELLKEVGEFIDPELVESIGGIFES